MKISIALCTYNGEKYVTEQLQSLFDQTLKPDEIVVSDDGSSDQTLNIVRDFSNRNIIPITIFEHKENLGVFKNFVFCIKACTGDIIFTCDQDDYWLPTKLEKHMQVHKVNPNTELVYSNAEVVLNTIEHVLYPLWEPKSIEDSENGKSSFNSLVVKGQSIAGCCMSFKYEFFMSILPIPDNIYHDDWIATSACLSGNIIGINEPLIKYRQHGNNVVGIVRGSKLSFYKSLLTNVKFYTQADSYIYNRHQVMYGAMRSHPYLKKVMEDKRIDQILELFQARSNYHEKSFVQSIYNLSLILVKGLYKHLNGFWTYLMDIYNLIYTKLFIKRVAN